jgi:hypothetical protein
VNGKITKCATAGSFDDTKAGKQTRYSGIDELLGGGEANGARERGKGKKGWEREEGVRKGVKLERRRAYLSKLNRDID